MIHHIRPTRDHLLSINILEGLYSDRQGAIISLGITICRLWTTLGLSKEPYLGLLEVLLYALSWSLGTTTYISYVYLHDHTVKYNRHCIQSYLRSTVICRSSLVGEVTETKHHLKFIIHTIILLQFQEKFLVCNYLTKLSMEYQSNKIPTIYISEYTLHTVSNRTTIYYPGRRAPNMSQISGTCGVISKH